MTASAPDSKLPANWLGPVFHRAETLDALAAKIDVDAAGLRDSVRRIGEYAKTGIDADFAKGALSIDRYYSDPQVRPNSCLGPIDKPPYYAMRLDAGEIGSKGGLLTDADARVLREDGSRGQGALVTGAGQGVGRGIALALAREGAVLALVGRTRSKLDAVAQEIAAFEGKALAFAADIKSAASIDALIGNVVANCGGLQILVNNAQEVPLGKLDEVSDAAFTAGWESGPLATLRLMRAAHPHLKANGGNIINLASPAAMRWDAGGYGAYAAVKEAIRQLTRAAACETDIGRFVATLCSDDCRYINGQSIAVDGGQAYLG